MDAKDIVPIIISAVALFASVVLGLFTCWTRRYDVQQTRNKDREQKEQREAERLRQQKLSAAACNHRYSAEGIQDAADLVYSYKEACLAGPTSLWDVLTTGRCSEFDPDEPDRLKNSLYAARQAVRKTRGFWDEVLRLWQAGELPDDFFGVWDEKAKKMEKRMWLFRANNHRELVEPFEIANHFRRKIPGAYKRGSTFPAIEKLWQDSEQRQGKDTFVSSLVWCHALARGEVPGNNPTEEAEFVEPPLVKPATPLYNGA